VVARRQVADAGDAQDPAPGAHLHAARAQVTEKAPARLLRPQWIVQEPRRHSARGGGGEGVGQRSAQLVVQDDVALDEDLAPGAGEVLEQGIQELAGGKKREPVHRTSI